MAIYDKLHGDEDYLVYSYFRRDFIYRENMRTRFCVALGGLLLLGIYYAAQIFLFGQNIFEMNYNQIFYDSVLFLVALMAFYTTIGTIKGAMQYYKTQKRIDAYLDYMQRLDEIEEDEDDARADLKKRGSLVYSGRMKF